MTAPATQADATIAVTVTLLWVPRRPLTPATLPWSLA